jgi:signal peptidase II
MANGAELGGRRLFWTILGTVLVLDLATKVLAQLLLARHLPLEIVGDWIQLRLVYNEGAAFGLHLGEYSRWIFLVLSVIALIVLGSMMRTTHPGDRLRLGALGLVCGGAAGNLIDRLRSPQGVVDFLDIGVGALRWPTFNVADSAITIGAIALATSLWLEGRAAERGKEARAAEP